MEHLHYGYHCDRAFSQYGISDCYHEESGTVLSAGNNPRDSTQMQVRSSQNWQQGSLEERWRVTSGLPHHLKFRGIFLVHRRRCHWRKKCVSLPALGFLSRESFLGISQERLTLCPWGARISTQSIGGAKLTILQLLSEDEVLVPANSMVKVPKTEWSQHFLLDYKANREKRSKNFT